MAGLYIHIPFCKSRCIYCGFYSTVDLNLRQQYVDALCREMTLRPSSEPIKTIYLGGGTPSQLSIPQLRQLFLYINKVYGNDAEEITIEMNPDDVTMQAVNILRNAGSQNISIDLMYGFPNETLDDWKRDIDEALSLNVEHISAYCLMIEEGTVLYEQMRNEKLGMRNEETERAMYELLMDRLTETGYEHYEISNFARPGYRSRHNSSYWHDVPYIGLGAAAHSYDLKSRSWNIADIKEYVASIHQGELPAESEDIDEVTHYNDGITTALRTSDGLDLSTLSERFRSYCLKEAQPFMADGLLQLTNNHLALTRRGLFVSDYVMSSLIFV